MQRKPRERRGRIAGQVASERILDRGAGSGDFTPSDGDACEHGDETLCSRAEIVQHSGMVFSVIPFKYQFPVAYDKHTMHLRIFPDDGLVGPF
ncbi:hypothetical protein D3C73_1120930 [compost metagenome]